MICSNKRRPNEADPCEDVAEAKAQRGAIVARWIAGARCRDRRHAQLASTPPWSASAGAVATRAMLPFAAGYFLSYLLRNVNGTLAGGMVEELGIGADKLGQLTSADLLVFAAAQLPVGAMLDRWGAGRVQTSSFAWLLVGRALVGLGTAGCLVAGMQASAAWFPRERLPLVNGAFIMCGGLGAFAATWSVGRALHSLDWHAAYGALALGCLTVAISVATFVPRARPAELASDAPVRLRDTANDPQFRRFTPLSACWRAARQAKGLWAAKLHNLILMSMRQCDATGLCPQEVTPVTAPWLGAAHHRPKPTPGVIPWTA